MPSTCCVPGCNDHATFRLPEDQERLKVWLGKICRDRPGHKPWKPLECDRICSKHFRPEDITVRKAINSNRTWRVLNPDAIPLKTTESFQPLSGATTARQERAKKRKAADIDVPLSKLPCASTSTTMMGQDEEESFCLRTDDMQNSQYQQEQGTEIEKCENENQDNICDYPILSQEEHQDVHSEANCQDDLVIGADDGHKCATTDNVQDSCFSLCTDVPEIALELDVVEDCDGILRIEQEVEEDEEDTDSIPSSLQTLSFGNFCVESLSRIPGGFQYYTSLTDIHHFNYVFNCLGPAALHLKYKSKKLKPEDELLLTLIKLRHNKDDQELAFFFGLSRFTVSHIFKTWINFMYYQWKELNIWNSRQLINTYFPKDFKAKFPKTRIVIDATEIPIEKPKDLHDQSATWSNYKNKNTLKVIVGIAPRGDITYISDVYGGSASDRQITERSSLLAKANELFDPGDSVMGDKGFIVQDLFLLKHVFVNIPTVMRGLTQIPADKLVKDRKIAAKRVHIERIIGLAKTYKILKDDLDHSYIPLGGRILFVCFSICNFKPCIVSSNA